MKEFGRKVIKWVVEMVSYLKDGERAREGKEGVVELCRKAKLREVGREDKERVIEFAVLNTQVCELGRERREG